MIDNKQILEELHKLKSEDITKSLLREYFIDKMKTKARFKMNDKVVINLSKWGGKGTKLTQIGRYIYNVLMNEEHNNFVFFKINGYVDLVQSGDGVGAIDGAMSYALLEGVLSEDDYISYIEQRDWFGYLLSKWILPSMTKGLTTPLKEIEVLKDKLFAENAEGLKKDPIVTTSKIEKELLTKARELLKGDPGMDIYDSYARGSFNNNYKNANVMRGVISSPSNKNDILAISSSSLSDGIKKEEFSSYSNILVSANAARSLQTQKGGYLNKLYSSTYQSTVLGKLGSDCGTTKTKRVTITPLSIKKNSYMFRYIVDGGKLILLDNKTISKYAGKTVNMRSPMYCNDSNYCNKCSGDLYFKLGVTNIGLLLNRPAGILMNLAMKSFHDMSLRILKVNVWDMID